MLSFFTFAKDLTTIRKALILAAILFIAGGMIGWIGTGAMQKLIEQQLQGLSNISKDLKESDYPQWSFFKFIFLNNSIKSVFIIFLGAFFGILPAIFLLINGAVIGYLIHLSVLQEQDLYTLIVKGLLPHGIIEIPAIIIACAFGLQFGGKIFAGIFGTAANKEKGSNAWPVFMKQTLTASVWIVILLLIAAIIESTITFSLLS
ncbi:stage II sporulation protein M [Paenibacillus sp. FSL L8-0470]|uniref:stage II sporulation protein M n=1 Tax=Paenibacillus sp. FSL L8-0470 TaxID=2954688 RepID=UPI0030FCA6A1